MPLADFAHDEIQLNFHDLGANLGVEVTGWDIDHHHVSLKGNLEPARVFALMGEPEELHQRLLALSFNVPLDGTGRTFKDWANDLDDILDGLTPAQQRLTGRMASALEKAVKDEMNDAERQLDLYWRLETLDESLTVPAALEEALDEIELFGRMAEWPDDASLFDQIRPVPGVEHVYQDLYDLADDFLAGDARVGFVRFLTLDGEEYVAERLVGWKLADQDAWLTALWREVSGVGTAGGEHERTC